jgi:hypothetical protein
MMKESSSTVSGHGKGRAPVQRDGAYQAKHQHQQRHDQQRQGVAAVQPVLARPVHQDGGDRRAADEGQQGTDGPQHQHRIAQHQVVGEHGDKACHVGGVEPHHQKARRRSPHLR